MLNFQPVWGPQYKSGITILTIQNLHHIYKLECKYWHFWCGGSSEDEEHTHIIFTVLQLSLFNKGFPLYFNHRCLGTGTPLPPPNIKTPGTLIIKTSFSLSEDGSVQNMSVKIVQIHPINVFIWAWHADIQWK